MLFIDRRGTIKRNMRLLEYEAKQLLAAHGTPIPTGWVITSKQHSGTLPLPLVVKSQIPTGGRGKAGGVKMVFTDSEFMETTEQLLTKPILGYRSNTLLVEQVLEIKQELYLSITIDRTTRTRTILAHRQGGIDIETAVHDSDIFKIPLPGGEPSDTAQQALLEYYGLPENLRQPLANLVNSLWQTCINDDAVLVEINPLVVTNDDRLVCADAKIELDDAASFRHQWNYEQSPETTQFVALNIQGTIGSMANGAGLAMATVDAIQSAGAVPANFLDVGGGTNADDMVLAFRRIGELPNIKGIVVNIFGGITRCDEVASAIVEARQSVENLPPLFIRLTGTNEEKGKAILAGNGISTLPDLKSCVQAAAGGIV